MRYAILSDIHGNYVALEAVLQSIRDELVDQAVCLGDIVGYGPQPQACVQSVLKNNMMSVAGNHDFAVTEKIDISTFNVYAKESTLWTREALDSEATDFLSQLPLSVEMSGFTMVHGTLHTPELFDYVQTCYDAHLSMTEMEQPLCFIGHSHVPVAFVGGEAITYDMGPTFRVDPDARTIVNVGSVGQPRDQDPRACYAIFDTETQQVDLKRVRYDIDEVCKQIVEAGLPRPLGERLRVGR